LLELILSEEIYVWMILFWNQVSSRTRYTFFIQRKTYP